MINTPWAASSSSTPRSEDPVKSMLGYFNCYLTNLRVRRNSSFKCWREMYAILFELRCGL